MASINFFARIGNLFKGFLSLFVSNIEKDHPDIAYQNAIDSMIEKFDKLKNATAALIRRRQDIEARLDTTQRDYAQTCSDLDAAVASGQDDMSLLLIPKKESLEAALADLKTELAGAVKDADSAKDSLLQVKGDIDKLKAEKDRMLAQMQSADARIKIQGQLDGLSVDAEVKALDNVREHIKNTVAKANLGAELHDSDIDVKLAQLRKTGAAQSAQTKLDALKKARAAQQTADPVQKTL
jgi:phage shock protein A